MPVAPVLGIRNCDTCRFDNVAAVSETGGYAPVVIDGFLVVGIERDYANIGMNRWLNESEMSHSQPHCRAHP